MVKRLILILSLLLLAVVPAAETATVTRVVDGDTIVHRPSTR
ncbi:MAG: hypothetical protein ACREAA_04965 [Candidatus Polarisedimenticolia bacterium]